MTRLFSSLRYILPVVLAASLCFNSCARGIKQYKISVVKEYPHDEASYTQGLFFDGSRCTRARASGASRHSGKSISRAGNLSADWISTRSIS
ncbi:MAG: glutaminyl-peptide cyclotransferase [Bacteroidales bacterium]|nr:glutaminyl-peptide cyclotransferase [Bacteroidales bacterium]